MLQVNNRPIGENLPHLVTLIQAQDCILKFDEKARQFRLATASLDLMRADDRPAKWQILNQFG
jgi:hypothetical protein